jgi:hypothetical protein
MHEAAEPFFSATLCSIAVGPVKHKVASLLNYGSRLGKLIGGVEVFLRTFLSSALDEGE